MITSVDYDKLNECTMQCLMQPCLKKKKKNWAKRYTQNITDS